MTKEEIINDYLAKYPNLASLTLAKKIYNENNLYWFNVESVRTLIRYHRGTSGKNQLKKIKKTTFLSEEKYRQKYNLPESIETEYIPFQIIANKALIFSDVHIPFHNLNSIYRMFDFALTKNIDSIVINGDFIDCFELSYFDKEPNISRFSEEKEKTKVFLKELITVFSNVKIYYKFGNHEKRFESYLMRKAPEIFDNPEFRLSVLLDLYNFGIVYIPQEKYIQLGRLAVLHGHEYVKAITSPASPARTIFLRAKANALVGHYHQTSAHTERSIDSSTISTWSIGCLCELHPAYMPLNKWNHGFALYTKEDEDFWNIENKMIIKGRVL